MLTIPTALAIWVVLSGFIILAVRRVTSKPFPSPPATTGPEESVFDIEDYQWRDAA